MRGLDFLVLATEINEATSLEALDRIEERLRDAQIAGEDDERTRFLLLEITERREAIRPH
jgi:hypothetical protein